MVVNLASVQTGMDVLDPTGEKIGTVADVLNVQAYSATDNDTIVTEPATGATADLQMTTVTPDPSGQQTYLKVEQGGILGIGAKDLYIPLSAVETVVPGDNVTVNCTKDTCGDMYGTKPDFLP
jgi:hypothetical protein